MRGGPGGVCYVTWCILTERNTHISGQGVWINPPRAETSLLLHDVWSPQGWLLSSSLRLFVVSARFDVISSHRVKEKNMGRRCAKRDGLQIPMHVCKLRENAHVSFAVNFFHLLKSSLIQVVIDTSGKNGSIPETARNHVRQRP